MSKLCGGGSESSRRSCYRFSESDPLGKLMFGSIHGGAGELAWLTESPLLADFATELTGIAGGDPQGAKWVVRVVLSLMYWPAENDEAERRLVEKYVAPAFAEQS